MLPAALSSDNDGQSQETITILSNVNPSHPSHPLSSAIASTPRNATLPVTGDSNNGSRLEENENDTSDANDTDPGTDTAIDSESDIEGDAADSANSRISIPSDGGRPEGYTTGVYSSLRMLVAEAKGAASKPVVRFIKKYLKGTKLIFVVGQTGTGKSSLLRELTGQDITVGTEEYEVCPAIIHGEQYLFVDTAGFGASDVKDFDNFYDVMSCLDALAPFVTIAGVLFVYGGTQDRMHAHDLTTIQWVKCFCGPQFYKYITIVTTKWDTLREESFTEAWRRFAGVKEDPVVADILSPVTGGRQRYHGGSVYHHGVVMDDDNPTNTCADERAAYAREMIRDRYSGQPKAKLQVLREMIAGVSWDETEAAKVLRNSHLTIKLNVRGNLLRVTVIPDEKPATVELDAKRRARRSASTLRPVTALVAIPLPIESKEDPWTKKPPRSWYDRLWYWLEKAKELAVFYREQRRKAAANGTSTTAWADLVGTLRHWWSGPRY
ncbi:P-loop containing nucleoside triphosphate hydrolase protein [Chaetomium sp. MPI-CAGE-AT-0009]|nr:P-loop containing nucleoside triphosphate hydrolase protein [Chaetomium sp. MPI-CAGE-AT-0009]